MEYAVTFHAAMRYKHRVRPDLSIRLAGLELAHRIEAARVETDAPPWAVRDEDTDAWLFLDEDTVAVVMEDRVVTVLTRAMADALVRRQCRRLGWVREAA